MRVKLLLFPVVIIGIVVMLVWFIWPAYQEVQKQNEILSAKHEQLSSLTERKQLVEDLSRDLSRDAGAKSFLFHYLPTVPDEEYVINAVNDAAVRSEVNLTSLSIVNDPRGGFFAPADATPRRVSHMAEVDSAGEMVVPQVKKQDLDEYAVNVVVTGEYTKVKNFLSQVHRIDRLHGVATASISEYTPEEVVRQGVVEGDEDVKVDVETMIIAQILVTFAHVPDVIVPKGAGGQVFHRDISEEMTFIQGIQADHESAPVLEVSTTGRANPFDQSSE